MDRLYRSRDDRMLAGVAGGLAEMWGADPSLVRVIWALLIIFTGGIALLVYIVMALVVPEEPDVAADAQALVATPPPGAGADWTPPADAAGSPAGRPRSPRRSPTRVRRKPRCLPRVASSSAGS